MALELIGGLVAEEFQAIAAFNQRHALGDEAFEFDRADLRAVLLFLAAPLLLLIVVEFPSDPVGGAVEEIDRRPEQVLEVWFEAGVGQRRDQRVENVGDGSADGVCVGQWPRVRFVLKRSVAVELKFGEDVVCRR